MTSRDFCYWLQGFIELQEAGLSEPRPHDAPEPPSLRFNAAQARMVKQHLALVFKHEIDPSQGNKQHQMQLQAIHQGLVSPPAFCAEDKMSEGKAPWQQGPRPDGTQVRC